MTTTNPSEPSGDRLALLYRLSRTFNSSLDLDEVLNRVMDEVHFEFTPDSGNVLTMVKRKQAAA